MSNEYEHSSQAQQVNVTCAGISSGFEKRILRIIENNNDLTNDEQTQEEVKRLNEEIIRATIENEAIVANDASCQEDFMAGVWIIEDYYKIVSE